MNTEERKTQAPGNGEATLADRVRSLRLGDRGLEPRAPRNLLPWAICVILLLTTAAFGFRAYRGGPKKDGPDKGRPTTAVASAGEVVLQAKGYVVPLHPVQVSPKVGGMLLKVHKDLEEGRFFKKGQWLAKIEDVDYKAECDMAEHSLAAAEQRLAELKAGNRPEEIEQAKAELDEANENVDLAKRDLIRGEELRRARTGAIALNEYDKLRSTLRAARERQKRAKQIYKLAVDGPRIERKLAAESEVKQLTAALAKAKWRLENCIIRAPISGTILTKKAEEGNIVNPSAFSSGISASLCDMADLSDIEIDLSIQERDIASVWERQECQVMPEAYQNNKEFLSAHPHGYRGQVSRLMPTADRAKGAIPVRVRILPGQITEKEAGKYLRPDMGALVSFLSTTGK
jgi:multidrug resistance efflux pump